MAHFKSVVTDIGAEKIAAIVAGGGKLSLTRAAVGSGRTDSDRAAMTALVKEENAEIQTGDLEVTTSGGMTVLRLPVQVTNKGQSVPLPVREVGLYSQDAEGEYLFAVSWLGGEDTDNIIPPPADPEAADTVHIHDVGIVVTNQEASVIEVSMGLGGMATAEQLEAETKARIEADADLEGRLSDHLADTARHIITLTHSKEGSTHTLTGLPEAPGIYTAQFKATADFLEGDTFADGWTAKPTGEETSLPDKVFVTGDIVSATVDVSAKRINFKLGGGGYNDTLPALLPNFTADWLDDETIILMSDMVSADDNPVLAGARWVYDPEGETYPDSPRDGTVLEMPLEELVY